MHYPIMSDGTASPGAIQAADDQLRKLAGSLLESLNKGGAESIEAPLEQIYHYFREKTWKKSTNDALLQTWSACALLLDEDLNPEAYARALHILRSLAQFCTKCGTPVFEDWTQLDVGSLVGRIAACMQRYPQSITLQTSACALFSRLAGCSSCGKANSSELIAALDASVAVPALAQALISLQAHASVPAAMVCASEALTALRFIIDGDHTKIDLIAEAGGVQLIAGARDIAQGQGSSDTQVLQIMSHLSRRSQATFQEVLAASNAAIDAAYTVYNSGQTTQHQQPQKNEEQYQFNLLRAEWDLSQSVDTLAACADADKGALTAFAERTGAIAIEYLKRPDMESEIARIWMRFLYSLLCCISRQGLNVPTITISATAFLVADEVFNKTTCVEVRSLCMYALFSLLGCCQPLDATQSKELSVVVAACAISFQKPFAEHRLLGGEKSVTLAVNMIHALACIGSLGHKDALTPAQALSILTTALCILTDTTKNKLIESTDEWDATQITWEPLSGAVRATVDILLAAGPAALNAAYDADGYTLVHHLAAFGQSKCLEIVLQASGDNLDLLARTKSGATALQLARQGRHSAAALLLEEVTQGAAEARQAALLEELEAADKDDSARKAKKKKSVTRSASFAAEQPDEKSQKTVATTAPDDHHHRHHHHQLNSNGADTNGQDGVDASSTANAAEQARVELRQRLEEEYERALEERRMELANKDTINNGYNTTTIITTNTTERATSMAMNSDSSSAENPSTPRAMLEAGIHTDNGGSGGAGSGSNSNSGAEDDLMMVGPPSLAAAAATAIEIDAAVPAPVAVPASTAAIGGSLMRRTPSELSPFTSPGMAINALAADSGLGFLGATAGAGAADSPAAAAGPSSSSIQREHSLFGSPSLTGNLFGSYGSGSPGFSTGLHASSPAASTGLLSGGGGGIDGVNGASVFGNGLSNDASEQLPDALFIHHGLTTEDLNNSHASNSINRNNANLLASLAGGSTNFGSVSGLSSASSLQSHVVPQMNSVYGQRVPSVGGTTGTGSGSSDGDSDASSDPTRHLWIGNLGTRTPRAVLKAVFETHGIVEDVVTFPGRMYAFVNYCTTDEAVQATTVLQNQIVPELTGDRPLLLKYRPVKKAEMHLRSLGDGMLDGDIRGTTSGLVASAMGAGHGFGSSGGLSSLGGGGGSGSLNSVRSSGLLSNGANMMAMMMPGSNSLSALNDPDGNCSDPSPRIWLGNIAPTATSKTLQAVLGRFGPLTDAAVFPARIGPLGYAFVKFEALEDAVRALETLNNTVVPPLSGSKQLKMRYKPAASGPAGREESIESTQSSRIPSRHLWLGNITQKPTEDIIFQAFSKYGRVDSARVFPAKAYAFVNFSDMSAAVHAMAELEGVCIPCLTGVKPLVMRFQQENQQQPTGPPLPLPSALRASMSLANLAGGAAVVGALSGNGGGGFGAVNNHHISRVQSESALALAASLNQLVPGGAGLSDDHPHGLVGVVPNTTNSGGNGGGSNWGPEQAAQMHRSHSLNLLNQAARNVAAAAPSPYNNNLLGGGMSNSNSLGSASSSQLSAVLNNLAALQRAASVGNAGGAPAHQDIASLSTMLASQSLASHDAQAMSMRSASTPAVAVAVAGGGWNVPSGNGNMNTQSGLEGLLCPLSKQLMTDPVVAADGVTYHRPAISEWMASQTISPVMQTPLPHGGLIPNHAVKDAVLGYLRMQLRVAA